MEMRSIIKKNKKGQLQTLGPSIIALVIAAVFLILGLVLLQEFRDTSVVGGDNAAGGKFNDTARVQTNLTLTGLGTFANFWEIIVLAVVISIVIGLLLIAFGGRGAR